MSLTTCVYGMTDMSAANRAKISWQIANVKAGQKEWMITQLDSVLMPSAADIIAMARRRNSQAGKRSEAWWFLAGSWPSNHSPTTAAPCPASQPSTDC